MLEIRNLTLRFGGLTVLDQVALEARPGEVTALIGPNGAGKSALLNCISGHYRPEPDASIRIGGTDIGHLAAHRRAAAGLSRTFQHIHLVPELSMIDNIMAGLTPVMDDGLASMLLRPLRQIEREKRRRALAEQAVHAFGLAEFMHEPVASLPLGVQRKIDFARATVSRPKVILLDEPASGLSRHERRLIPDWIAQVALQSESVIIWIEHDIDLLLSCADSVIVLQHGEIAATGRPRQSPADRRRVVHAYFNGAGAPAGLSRSN